MLDSRPWIRDLLELVGVGAILYGLALVWFPIAFVLGGFYLVILSRDLGKPHRQ